MGPKETKEKKENAENLSTSTASDNQSGNSDWGSEGLKMPQEAGTREDFQKEIHDKAMEKHANAGLKPEDE